MKPLLLILLLCPFWCRAQYWNSDFRLPRLKGVKRIVVRETRWESSPFKKPPTISKSVLWLNRDGLVVREDEYGPHSWIDTRTTYEYIGNDTEITYIRIFVYPGQRFIGQRPPKGDRLQQSVEFVNEHGNPLHREWRFYQLDDSARKRLLNITSTEYDSAGKYRSGHYYSYEAMRYVDSTAYRYEGDTLISVTFRTGQSAWSSEQNQVVEQDVSVSKQDAAGRLIYAERLASSHSHMNRRSHFLYDRQGRYLGERYEQDCDTCGSRWQKGGDRRSYDAKSRLKAIVHSFQGRVTMRYDLEYVE